MSLFNELKQRNVFRVGAAYVVSAWLVIQVVETIFPAFGFGDEAVRIVAIIFAIGLAPTLVFAWVFELTPEGLKRDSEVDRRGPVSDRSGRKLDRAIMVVLALALGYFAFDKFILDPAEDESIAETARQEGRSEALVESYGDQSIAVLAFDDMSPDGDQEYLSDGIAEEILNLLARIPELRVISRSSAFSYKDKDVSIPTIAGQLNVGHILEGSVRKAGDRIRITAQLIDARSDTHLWSETYDRLLDDVFAIQDEIAERIVEKLHVELVGSMPTSRRTDPVALALTIQAKAIWYNAMGGSFTGVSDRMAPLLDRALEIDPDYTEAIAWLAYANWTRQQEGLISSEEGQQRFEELAERALAIDPEHAMILQLLAFQESYINVNPELAAELYQRALRSAPNNAEVLRQVGRFAYNIGHFDTSNALLERAVALDPLCTMCLYFLSRSYMVAGKLEKAADARRRFLLLGGSGGYYHYGLIKLMAGDAEGALAIFMEPEKVLPPEQLVGLAMAYHSLDRFEESDAAITTLIEKWGGHNPVGIAQAYAWRNDKDAAFEWLDKAPGEPGERPGMFVMGRIIDPLLRNLHDDPRWGEFRKRLNMTAERVAAIDFHVDIPIIQ